MIKEVKTNIISTKKKIDIVNKTDKSQPSPETIDTSKNNKNYTVDRADKSRSIPVTNLSNKITQIEKHSKISIHRDNKDASYLYIQRDNLASVTPDNIYISSKKHQTVQL